MPANGFAADDVLRLAASLDQGSEHPRADSIFAAARHQRLSLAEVAVFESNSGIDVRGSAEGHELTQGNTVMARQAGADPQLMADEAEALREQDSSVMFLMSDGVLAVSDPVKASNPEALAALQKAICASSWPPAMA